MCPDCGAHNFASKVVCYRCSTDRYANVTPSCVSTATTGSRMLSMACYALLSPHPESESMRQPCQGCTPKEPFYVEPCLMRTCHMESRWRRPPDVAAGPRALGLPLRGAAGGATATRAAAAAARGGRLAARAAALGATAAVAVVAAAAGTSRPLTWSGRSASMPGRSPAVSVAAREASVTAGTSRPLIWNGRPASVHTSLAASATASEVFGLSDLTPS